MLERTKIMKIINLLCFQLYNNNHYLLYRTKMSLFYKKIDVFPRGYSPYNVANDPTTLKEILAF